jgi:hypothetical protein
MIFFRLTFSLLYGNVFFACSCLVVVFMFKLKLFMCLDIHSDFFCVSSHDFLCVVNCEFFLCILIHGDPFYIFNHDCFFVRLCL